jgi:hypothetical protein
MKRIIYLLTAALAFTWGAYGQTSNKAEITFFRPWKYVGSARTPSLYIDGKQILRMDNGRYYTIELTAGEHVLQTAIKKYAPITVKLNPGDHLYFWMAANLGPWPADLAQEKIRKLKPLDAKWVIQPNVSSLSTP